MNIISNNLSSQNNLDTNKENIMDNINKPLTSFQSTFNTMSLSQSSMTNQNINTIDTPVLNSNFSTLNTENISNNRDTQLHNINKPYNKTNKNKITKINVKEQILSNSYKNDNAVGLELDYINKKYNRIAAAKDLIPGKDFNKFNMFGGRKRCIVDTKGNIVRFLTNNEDISTLEEQRIMIYQPAFYYLRVPIITTKIDIGIKIDKEHLYLSDNEEEDFKLHPAFIDKQGNELKYILLPAFESSVYRKATNSFEKNDTQDIDLTNDCLVSIINSKPTSGKAQSLTSNITEKMAENNGEGWTITNLEFESLNQMLMMIEFGSPNIQELFNIGLTKMIGDSSYNMASNTGSTLFLNNTSGQAKNTINIQNKTLISCTKTGECAISYRGMENPYGNIWRFIQGLSTKNKEIYYNNKKLNFKLPNSSGWISSFGYDPNFDWAYLPIEVKNSCSIGDYCYTARNDDKIEYEAIIGGYSTSAEKAGIFYYSFNTVKDAFHYQHDSAKIMFTPIADSIIHNNNYELWLSTINS